MRKIDQQITGAIQTRQAFVGSNTSVWIRSGAEGHRAFEVVLHGNAIVQRADDHEVVFSLCGWATRTTRRRLNVIFGALGFPAFVHQDDGHQVLVIPGGDDLGAHVEGEYTQVALDPDGIYRVDRDGGFSVVGNIGRTRHWGVAR